jgi:hypothetical protein
MVKHMQVESRCQPNFLGIGPAKSLNPTYGKTNQTPPGRTQKEGNPKESIGSKSLSFPGLVR